MNAVVIRGQKEVLEVAEKIIDPEGQYIKEFEPTVNVELVGMDKYLALIRDGLVGAVNDKHGTGKAARMTARWAWCSRC